jgi:EF-hand domain pair
MSIRICIATLLMAGASMTLAQNAAPPAGQGGERAHTDRTVRFKQIDKNGDGKLSLQEFQTRPSNQTPEPKVDAKELANRADRFSKVDKDGDGFLTFEEFLSLESIPVVHD